MRFGKLLIGLLVIPLTGQLEAGVELQEVAQLEAGPGNLTLTPNGDVILSLHEFYAPELRVVRLAKGNALQPFPNRAWNTAPLGAGGLTLDSVLGIQSDTSGVVWMLDNGRRSAITPKLVAWDKRADRLFRVIHLPSPITPENAFVNDLAIDEKHDAIYIADPAGGNNAALIVVDINTGSARRVLQGHTSVVPEDIDLVIDDKPVQIKKSDGGLVRPRVGVNPIGLDAQSEYLYYGAMHGTSLYRLKVDALLDATLSSTELAKRVERYSDKPICDGISIDRKGNIYITDIGHFAIGVIDTERRYRILVQDARLSWPDALSFGPDGWLYTVANQLHLSAVLNAGERRAEPPFRVLRLSPLATGITGR